MNEPPSEQCRDCVWWYEGPILCMGCPNNPESEIRKMPCSHCKEIIFLDKFYEITYEEDGLHLLCSKECQDKWKELRTTIEESVYL